jgi:hypothetical protein
MKSWRNLFLMAVLASAAWAQTDSGLFGIVKDQTGGGLPGQSSPFKMWRPAAFASW